MSATAHLLPDPMTVGEFLAWMPPHNVDRWELIEGVPRAMAPSSPIHGTILSEVSRLISNHLADHPRCRPIIEPGVQPRIRQELNVRIPDLGVTCEPIDPDAKLVSAPILLVEILSASNRADTWTNVWAYTSIPSLQEILVLDSTRVRADLLRRADQGGWPERPFTITQGDVTLASIGLTVPLTAFYRRTVV